MTTRNCNCGCSEAAKVLRVTQIDSQAVLDPENVEKRKDIMLISKNVNGVWSLTPICKVTLNAVAEAMKAGNAAAFIRMEWVEPSEEPEPPAPETPDEPDGPVTPENPDLKESDSGNPEETDGE